MKVKVVKLHADAILPSYSTPGANAFDIHCLEGGVIPPGGSCKFNTGLGFELPVGYAMLVFSRSGHGVKFGIRLANGVGVLDSDFRGDMTLRFQNDGSEPYTFKPQDRMAQGMIIPVPQIEFIETDSLSPTERGTSGIGSTGNDQLKV